MLKLFFNSACTIPCRKLSNNVIRGNLAGLTFDVPFKKAFSDTITLQHFLNSVIQERESFTVKSINNVEVKSFIKRSVIYDLHCSLSNGTVAIIEIQKISMGDLIVDRCVGYVSRDYSEQWIKNKGTEANLSGMMGARLSDYGGYALIPVISVAILDWVLENSDTSLNFPTPSLIQRYVSRIDERDIPSVAIQNRMKQLSNFTYVILPYAPEKADENCSDIEKWAILLRDSAKFSIESLPAVLQDEPFINAAKCARIENMTAEEYSLFIAETDKYRDDQLIFAAITKENAAITKENDDLKKINKALTEKLERALNNFANADAKLTGHDVADFK